MVRPDGAAFVAVTLPLLVLFEVVVAVVSPSLTCSLCATFISVSLQSSPSLVVDSLVAVVDDGLDLAVMAVFGVVLVLVDVVFLFAGAELAGSSMLLLLAAARARVIRLGGEAGAFAGARGAIVNDFAIVNYM